MKLVYNEIKHNYLRGKKNVFGENLLTTTSPSSVVKWIPEIPSWHWNITKDILIDSEDNELVIDTS